MLWLGSDNVLFSFVALLSYPPNLCFSADWASVSTNSLALLSLVNHFLVESPERTF